MERINDTISRITNKKNFQERYETIRKEILQHPDVQAFLKDHQGEITSSMIDRSLGKLYEFITQAKNCRECRSLEECNSIIPGYEPKLVLKNDGIDVHYVPCLLKILADKKREAEKLIQCVHVPREILEANFGDITLETPGRIKAVKKAERFVERYTDGHFQKGLYLYGPFGTGKTYLLGAIANALALKKVASMIVYVPEFVRELKQSIHDHTLEEKINFVKQAPVLMFDDIGAESMSSWVRDEVYGPILQYRMLEKLPTFFTSNFSLRDLEHHLTYTQRGEEEKLKAGRIIERIQFLAEPVKYDGPNKRFNMND